MNFYSGEACWWTVHPASKQRSEGEKVRVGDDVIFVSVATERYLVKKNFDDFKKNHFTLNIASYQGKQSIHCQRLFPRHTMERVAFWNWSEQT